MHELGWPVGVPFRTLSPLMMRAGDARAIRGSCGDFSFTVSRQAMRKDPIAFTDNPRTLHRRSLTRRVWCDADLPHELIDTVLRGDVDRLLFQSTPLQVKDRCVVARHDAAGRLLLLKRHAWGGAGRTLR